MYRQGDLLLIAAEGIPYGASRVEGGIVLSGEVTGHAHKMETGEVFELKGEKYIKSEGSNLVHEEHDTITLPEGIYQVIRQREYDENTIRYVSD